MKFVTTLRKISEEEFKEEEHPRTGDGKFTSKGGGVGKKTKVSKDKKTSNADRIENVKNDHFISRMLKAGVQPNEMDLQLAELDKKMEEQSNVKTERTFKHDFGDGQGELKFTGTPEYEKALIEHDKLYDEVSKKEEDEYRKSYGWKKGDPFRWTPHNDNPDSAEDGYGSNYTYKHLKEEEIDVMMREYWNDNMDRKEREDRYDYFHAKNIPYLNEDGKTPQELEEEMEEDRSDVSDYFFFTDKKTGKDFRGKGMTKAEIKKRAEHSSIGSFTRLNEDGSKEIHIEYERPLDYAKFHSKRIPAMNFGEKGSKTDKLWDDLESDEQGRILHDEQKYGDFYSNWQYDQEKLFYSWKSKQGNTGGDNVSGKHNELYSEYPELSKQELVLDKSDFEKMDKKYPDWRGHGEDWIFKEGMMNDKKRDLMRKRGIQTYFQQDPIERQKYVGVLFNGLNAYDKDMLAGDAFDYEAPNNPTEDDELRWEDLSDEEQSDVVREVENEEDEDSPRYDLEETFQKLQPKKAIGFDYEKGIPEPQNVGILSEWANRIYPFAYYNSLGIGGGDMNTKEAIIPQYPKVKQRTIKEHENQVKHLDSELKKETEKHKPTDAGEYWEYSTNTIAHDVEEFGEYVEKNESKLNLDLEWYKRTWDEKDWLYGEHPPKNEKEWRKHFIKRALRVGDSKIASKVHQLRHFTSLIKQNPKLAEKYQHILDKTDKLNHDNYDLFLKTPEFYRGTRTLELDHYLEYKNTGKQFDWSEKNYPYTALGMDKSTSQSPSEQRIDWEMKDGELSGGKVLITYEGDSVRELGIPVQYNTQSVVNDQGADGSEIIGFPNNMVSYTEREVRVNPNSKIPKIKEINFGINMGKYKDQKILPVRQRKMLLKKYLPLVGGDKSKIKFYKFVEHALESGYEVYAVEEFVEDEHPRDDDGKFTDKDGGGSTALSHTNVRKLFDTYYREDVKVDLEKQIEDVEKVKKDLQELIDWKKREKIKPTHRDFPVKIQGVKYKTFDEYADFHISAKRKAIDREMKELKDLKDIILTYDEKPYIDLGNKPDTHKIGIGGFKNSVKAPKNLLFKDDWGRKYSDPIVQGGITKEEWGGTYIDSSLNKRSSDLSKKNYEILKDAWNQLSDEDRELVDILKIRYSNKVQKNLGLHSDRFEHEMDGVMKIIQPRTVEITLSDSLTTPTSVINTLMHEIAHAKWSIVASKHPERCKKFSDAIRKLGSPTPYVRTYLNDAKEAEDSRVDQIRELKRSREHDKLKENYDEMNEEAKKVFDYFTEERIKNLNERVDREVKNADLLYGNEAHSEFFATLNSPTTNYGHRLKRKMMEDVAKLYKELHDE